VDWTSRNPALAQYHRYVWQMQNPNMKGSDDAFAVIMQRLQAAPAQSPQVQNELPRSAIGPDIVLPPPQFNMGQPPATLLQTAKSVPLVPRPSYQFTPQQPIPPPSQHSHAPQSQYVNAPTPAPASFANVLETQSEGSATGQYQHWASQSQATYTERPQQQPSQLLPPQPRPIAPNPSVQQAHPPFPQYHPQQSAYDTLQFWNSQNRR
jgi:hypothetical protein